MLLWFDFDVIYQKMFQQIKKMEENEPTFLEKLMN